MVMRDVESSSRAERKVCRAKRRTEFLTTEKKICRRKLHLLEACLG